MPRDQFASTHVSAHIGQPDRKAARRWFRYRLLGILLVGAGLIWAASRHGYQDTVKEIRRLGGRIEEYEYVPDWLPQFAQNYVTFSPEVTVVIDESRGGKNAKSILRLLGRFPRLKYLSIESDSIQDQDLRFLSGQSHLTELAIQGNQLRGEFVSRLAQHRNLELLTIYGAGLDDSLIPGLRRLPVSVETLRLSGPGITDEAMRSIGHLQKLVWLELADTSVTGAAFRDLQGLGQLSLLKLWDAPVTDEWLGELKNISHLYNLGLDGTRITDAGLKVLLELPVLQSLTLSGTGIRGEGFAQAQNNTIDWLDLSDTQITDANLAHLRSLRKLQSLFINSTAVTDAGVDILLEASPVRIVTAQKTRITVTKAREINKLPAGVFISLE